MKLKYNITTYSYRGFIHEHNKYSLSNMIDRFSCSTSAASSNKEHKPESRKSMLFDATEKFSTLDEALTLCRKAYNRIPLYKKKRKDWVHNVSVAAYILIIARQCSSLFGISLQDFGQKMGYGFDYNILQRFNNNKDVNNTYWPDLQKELPIVEKMMEGEILQNQNNKQNHTPTQHNTLQTEGWDIDEKGNIVIKYVQILENGSELHQKFIDLISQKYFEEK